MGDKSERPEKPERPPEFKTEPILRDRRSRELSHSDDKPDQRRDRDKR